MAKDSIHMLDEEGILELDDERKANMVNNLLVAIVSDKGRNQSLIQEASTKGYK